MSRERGQVSLELLIVSLVWLLVCILFLSGMLLIGSLMLTQSGVNRTAQQIATLGCVPAHVQDKDVYLTGIGVGDIVDVEIKQRNAASGSSKQDMPSCSVGGGSTDSPDQIADPSVSGSLISASITYKQQLIFPFGQEWNVTRSATAVSGRLER